MRLKWTPLPIEQLLDQLHKDPQSIVYCAQSVLGPTRLVLVELAQDTAAQHFDEIELWLEAIEAKIQAIEALRQDGRNALEA
jgi:hypothetical protein